MPDEFRQTGHQDPGGSDDYYQAPYGQSSDSTVADFTSEFDDDYYVTAPPETVPPEAGTAGPTGARLSDGQGDSAFEISLPDDYYSPDLPATQVKGNTTAFSEGSQLQMDRAQVVAEFQRRLQQDAVGFFEGFATSLTEALEIVSMAREASDADLQAQIRSLRERVSNPHSYVDRSGDELLLTALIDELRRMDEVVSERAEDLAGMVEDELSALRPDRKILVSLFVGAARLGPEGFSTFVQSLGSREWDTADSAKHTLGPLFARVLDRYKDELYRVDMGPVADVISRHDPWIDDDERNDGPVPKPVAQDAGYYLNPPAFDPNQPPIWVSFDDPTAPLLASLLLDLLPLVGGVKGVIELYTGRDMVTKEDLAWWEQMLTLVSLGMDAAGAGGKIARLARHGDDIGPVVRRADNAAGLARHADEFGQPKALYKTTDDARVGIESRGALPPGQTPFTDPFTGQVGHITASARKSSAVHGHIRASQAEFQVYDLARARGEIGLQRPGRVTEGGPDFITARVFDNGDVEVLAYDATINPRKTPVKGLTEAWRAEVLDAVSDTRLSLGNPALEEAIRQAANSGGIRVVNVLVTFGTDQATKQPVVKALFQK
ncbi:MAG TPA: pre-toxin TG domain-containing protein [Dehalococcoidia bacterium]|nr:pre-toxin TG domain-containing protein [Dehalococcoidia bacterium]